MVKLPHITPGDGELKHECIIGSEVCFTFTGSSPYRRVEHSLRIVNVSQGRFIAFVCRTLTHISPVPGDHLKTPSSSSSLPHPLILSSLASLSSLTTAYDYFAIMSYPASMMYDAHSNRSFGGGLRSRRQSFSHGADPYYSTPMQSVGLYPEVSVRHSLAFVRC